MYVKMFLVLFALLCFPSVSQAGKWSSLISTSAAMAVRENVEKPEVTIEVPTITIIQKEKEEQKCQTGTCSTGTCQPTQDDDKPTESKDECSSCGSSSEYLPRFRFRRR